MIQVGTGGLRDIKETGGDLASYKVEDKDL